MGRTRVWAAATIVVAVALLGAPAAAKRAPSPAPAHNWIEVVITPGPAGATGVHVEYGVTERWGAGTKILGAGMATREAGNIEVAPMDGPGDVWVDADGGPSVHVHNGTAQDMGFWVVFGPGDLAPGEEIRMLVFRTDSVFTGVTRDIVTTTGGSVEVTARTGGGAALITAVPDDPGVAVGVPGAWAGMGTATADIPDAVVGSMTDCDCIQTWSAPDGTSGTFAPTSLDSDFGGPAGRWSWSTTGARTGDPQQNPVAGAYAPIGDWTPYLRQGPDEISGVP